VQEIDGASNNGIDEIRALRENVKFAPAASRYKIYIIDEAHQITPQAFNALLKTLEEPPAHVVFLMATTESQKIPLTILSRCQRYRFRLFSTKEIYTTLEAILKTEKVTVDPEALQVIAASAGGSLRDSLSLLDQVISQGSAAITLKDVRDLLGFMPKEIISSAVEALSSQDGAKVVGLIKDVNDQGYNLVQLAHDLRDHLRRVLMYKINPAVLDIVSDDKAVLENQKILFTVPWLLRAGNLLSKALEEMRWSDDPRLILELYLLRLSQPYASINELLDRMENFSKEIPAVDYSASVQPVKSSQPQSQPVRSPQVREAPVETFSDTEPEPAVQNEPVAAGDNAELWRRAVVVLRKDMPLTGNLLSTARYKSLEGSNLTVAVRTKFEQEGIKRKKEDIEAVLKTAFNIPLNLNVVVDDNAAVSSAPRRETIISDEEKVVESADRIYKVVEAPAGVAPLPAGLEKILNKFPGKVKKKE
jgi:DNA polymerase-3 subunit gamma/tau